MAVSDFTVDPANALTFERSLLGDYMRHQSAIRSKPVAGISVNGKLAGMFVENEVLVNRRDATGIAFLVDKFGGEAIEPKHDPGAAVRVECRAHARYPRSAADGQGAYQGRRRAA